MQRGGSLKHSEPQAGRGGARPGRSFTEDVPALASRWKRVNSFVLFFFLDGKKEAYDTIRRDGKFVSKVDTKCATWRVVWSLCGNEENCVFWKPSLLTSLVRGSMQPTVPIGILGCWCLEQGGKEVLCGSGSGGKVGQTSPTPEWSRWHRVLRLSNGMDQVSGGGSECCFSFPPVPIIV